MAHRDAEILAKSLGLPTSFMEDFMGDAQSRETKAQRIEEREMATSDNIERVKAKVAERDAPVKTKPIEAVHHPPHYGGKDNPYEAIKVIEAWKLGFNLGNTVKYIARAGQKFPSRELEDLEKAAWYLNRQIQILKGEV